MVPAAVLVAVALTQIGLARGAGLSPWKGGGFGMFSTLDARPFRHVRISVEGENGWETVGVPAWAQAEAASVETFPRRAAFERLGQEVLLAQWSRGRAVAAVRIELWRDEHDPVTLKAVSRRIEEHVIRGPR